MDDALALSHSPEITMKDILLAFDIKYNNYGPPTAYLGANVEPFHMSDGKYSWIIKCNSYVAVAVQTIKYLLSGDNIDFKTVNLPHKGPLTHGYNPKLGVIDEFDADQVSWFQQHIGILGWAVELKRIDVQIEVTLLSQCQSSTLEVHLEAMYLIFRFLSNNPKKILVMDNGRTR